MNPDKTVLVTSPSVPRARQSPVGGRTQRTKPSCWSACHRVSMGMHVFSLQSADRGQFRFCIHPFGQFLHMQQLHVCTRTAVLLVQTPYHRGLISTQIYEYSQTRSLLIHRGTHTHKRSYICHAGLVATGRRPLTAQIRLWSNVSSSTPHACTYTCSQTLRAAKGTELPSTGTAEDIRMLRTTQISIPAVYSATCVQWSALTRQRPAGTLTVMDRMHTYCIAQLTRTQK